MWVYWVVMCVVLIISVAMMPKPKNAKPPALTDFDVPTAEDGREIPDFGGVVWFDDPNVLWYGDLSTSPIKAKGGGK